MPKKANALVGEDKQLEDEEEGFLNPEDLSLIDEKTWEPSDEEILSYALKLGYDIEKDPDELFEVAYYYMKYPLPEGWKRAIFKKTKELMYINMEDGEIEVCTEIEEMAHQMYLEKKEEMINKQLGSLDKDEKKETNKLEEKVEVSPLKPAAQLNTKSLLPPVKDKSGSKNNLFSEIDNEKEEKKEKKEEKEEKVEKIEKKKKKKKDIEDEFDFDGMDADFINDDDNEADKKKKNNNDDILGLTEKPALMKDSDDEEKKDKKDNKEAEESDNDKEYADDFDYDGLEEDSDLNKEEPLIKSMINKEKEKEEKEKLEKEKEKKEREEKEKKEKEEKEEKERKEKEEREKNEKERKEMEEKIRKERERKEKEEKEKKEKEEKERKERENREKEQREKEEKIRKEKEREKELNDKLVKEKKEYLNKKLQELQEYKDQKKLKYEKAKKEIEEKNKKLKEDHNSKLKIELNKAKNKLQSQYKEKLEFYETTLINKKLKEEKKYKEELENTYREKKNEMKENKNKEDEEKKSELKEKKTKLLKEINQEKSEKETNESNIKERKIKLQKNIKLLDEKKKIDINNINKKHEISIKDYEIEAEKKFKKEKEQMKEFITNNSSTNNNNLLLYNSSSSNLNISMSGINRDDENNEFLRSKIIDNIQKALEDEYEINCKEIEQELINNKMKEIEKYNASMEQEKKDKSNYYKNEITEIEKEYYKTLANIRQASQKKKMEGDNFLNVGFEQTLTQHEETKNKIGEDNKKLMNLVIEGIQKLMTQNDSLEQTEIHVEEFLLKLKDTYHLVFQKSKNTYEMSEYDYKYKKLFIKYLLEVINYLSKIFASSATDIYEVDKKYLAENLLKFCKDKINNFKRKFQNKKKKRIYKFLKDNLLSENQSFSTLSEFEDTRETNNIFVKSFKRKYDNEIPIEYTKNNSDNILNKIDVNESINNINKNSFIFKSKNMTGSFNFNNLNTFTKSNGFSNYNNNYSNNNELFKTRSTNDFNINQKFFNLLNKGQDGMNNLEYYTIDKKKNYSIPTIPERVLQNIDKETLMIYSGIILFLKNEYLKLIEISHDNNKSESNTNMRSKKNINLNLLILDKIKIYTEETFNFIINNYQNKNMSFYIQKKIQIVQNHIEDYKKNFNVDKYLSNPDLYKSDISAEFGKKAVEDDLENNMVNFNGLSYDKNYKNENDEFFKTENNGVNNLILNGNFNGYATK